MPSRAQVRKNMDSYVLKVRGGSDTYVKQDGSKGTAGKGALIEREVAFTLAATQDQTLFDGTGSDYIVRRLTPTECERLQGFPDGWTDIPWKGKEHAPDTPRYKALGNSMAVPCMTWIGARIDFVEKEVMGLQEQNFRKARMEAGMRPERAAAELDVSITTLLNWERGDTKPNADKLAAMARLYGTTADYLLQLA